MSNKSAKKMQGRLYKSPVKVINRKSSGLHENTMLEGSAIDITTPDSKPSFPKLEQLCLSPTTNNDSYKEKYFLILKTVEQLRTELKIKKCQNIELQEIISNLHSQNQTELEDLKMQFTAHKDICMSEKDGLKNELKVTAQEIEDLRKTREEQTNYHLKETKETNKRHVNTLIAIQKKSVDDLETLKAQQLGEIEKLCTSHSDITKAKDRQIEQLKKQISSTFNDNAKERQIQINELLKELKRVSDEADYVKAALKKLKIGENHCQKCDFYQNKCKVLAAELSQKEEISRDLVKICSKMEKQLGQQCELNDLWQHVKQRTS